MTFENKDVYELIDSIIVDYIITEHHDNSSVDTHCVHCGSQVVILKH